MFTRDKSRYWFTDFFNRQPSCRALFGHERASVLAAPNCRAYNCALKRDDSAADHSRTGNHGSRNETSQDASFSHNNHRSVDDNHRPGYETAEDAPLATTTTAPASETS